MTVIVYRDLIMASDTMSTNTDSKQFGFKKIVKCPITGDLYGFAGSADSIYGFYNWALSSDENKHSTKSKVTRVKYINETYGDFVVLHKSNVDHKLKLITAFGEEDLTHCEYVAIGAAKEVAYGALFTGASSIEAVKACIAHSIYAGGEVYNLMLGK
jgi:hypothetical protein